LREKKKKGNFKLNHTKTKQKKKVGFNRSDEFTVNWWEHLFNSAANKIKETSSLSSQSPPPQIVETSKTNAKESEIKEADDDDDDEQETNGNPLNKKSFYYSRFTKV
jgi:hypothetical protein